MELSELKKKFRHRSIVDIKDVEIAMKAVPFLVREIEKLEEKVAGYQKRLDHLSGLLQKKRPPMEKTGQKNKMKWEARVNEEENRLYINLSGELDYRLLNSHPMQLYRFFPACGKDTMLLITSVNCRVRLKKE